MVKQRRAGKRFPSRAGICQIIYNASTNNSNQGRHLNLHKVSERCCQFFILHILLAFLETGQSKSCCRAQQTPYQGQNRSLNHRRGDGWCAAGADLAAAAAAAGAGAVVLPAVPVAAPVAAPGSLAPAAAPTSVDSKHPPPTWASVAVLLLLPLFSLPRRELPWWGLLTRGLALGEATASPCALMCATLSVRRAGRLAEVPAEAAVETPPLMGPPPVSVGMHTPRSVPLLLRLHPLVLWFKWLRKLGREEGEPAAADALLELLREVLGML